MRLILVSGMSGSGKSVAVHLLEDLGFYCIDNLPSTLLPQACQLLDQGGQERVAVSIDARSQASLAEMPQLLAGLREAGHEVQVLFLTAATDSLVQRFSETRRLHPLMQRAPAQQSADAAEPTLEESIARERELLEPLHGLGLVIDSSHLAVGALRRWIRDFVDAGQGRVTLAFESFAFKNGVPVAADFVFDVRNLPNPFYETPLRDRNGLDAAVAEFLERSPLTGPMIDDIYDLVDRWLPSFAKDGRQYLTVAVGCTGGQHRSPYVAERLAARFAGHAAVLVRHRALAR